ncbi:Penicillin-binding protein 4B [Corynebacterium occultum]|uniref:Penicillin-binding protein 4B n=1 Tax=Corynebacterium occultum TaxID=2675219 RepID=A0A6B8VL25_9CORY|nr:penicillin-binding transpeptidase domain-containing protein [Corynebacterium occultum]QGU06142.1 Penicillin-binding protein 4B [Corynebacterium occultum]
MNHLTRTRSTATLAALSLLGLALTACSPPWSTDPVEEFISAFNAGDDAAVATLSDDPARATADLAALRAGIGATQVQLAEGDEVEGVTAVTATWTVPNGESVESQGQMLVSGQDAALIDWDKQIFAAELDADSTFLYSDDRDFSVPVLDRNGTQVLAWGPVTVVTASPELAPRGAEIAAAISPVVPEATSENVSAAIEAGEGDPVALYTLREEDFTQVGEELAAIEGLSFREEGRLLTQAREASSILDNGLREQWEEKISADAGWTLRATSPTTEILLGQNTPRATEPIRTTLDLGVQSAANRALESISEPATIVAVDTSGGVVAVAQNEAADAQGAISLTGLYPPGSTFKTVTTAAALSRGIITPDALVPCPASATIEGRRIPNDNDFELGEVTMTEAFAQSCNTTQGFISQELDPADMKNTAASLGLGVDFEVPGMTTVTGSVPVTEPGAARVEAAIGQGEVLASPFGLAVMEASLGNGGQMVLPTLIQGNETTPDQQPEPLDPEVVGQLRAMMAETVNSGTATALQDITGLGGKTGTAETGNGPAHGWFVGVLGDLAFATFIEGSGSSTPAVELSGEFLRDEALARWR